MTAQTAQCCDWEGSRRAVGALRSTHPGWGMGQGGQGWLPEKVPGWELSELWMYSLPPFLHLLLPALVLVCQLDQVLSEDTAVLASLNSPPSDGGALPSPWPLALCVSPHRHSPTSSFEPLISTSVLLAALSRRHTPQVTNGRHTSTFKFFSNHVVKSKKKQMEGFPGGAVVENLPVNAGDTGSSPGLGGSHMPRSN